MVRAERPVCAPPRWSSAPGTLVPSDPQYASDVSLLHVSENQAIESPTMVVAFDGWVDAGSASTTAAAHLAASGDVVATIDADAVFDYRARRPTLDIRDGRPSELTWPELVLRRRTLGGHELLVLVGPEPDYRWQESERELAKLARRLGVIEWISLGRSRRPCRTPDRCPSWGPSHAAGCFGRTSSPVPPGCCAFPAAAISALDIAIAGTGIPALGYFAQIPHYISGPYPTAAMELLRTVAGTWARTCRCPASRRSRSRCAPGWMPRSPADETTRAYVERLEGMVDEARLPSGDELISDIERFLRDRGTPGNRLN